MFDNKAPRAFPLQGAPPPPFSPLIGFFSGALDWLASQLKFMSFVKWNSCGSNDLAV
jgi:hypothetical protein